MSRWRKALTNKPTINFMTQLATPTWPLQTSVGIMSLILGVGEGVFILALIWVLVILIAVVFRNSPRVLCVSS
jgi:hypothetical protein